MRIRRQFGNLGVWKWAAPLLGLFVLTASCGDDDDTMGGGSGGAHAGAAGAHASGGKAMSSGGSAGAPHGGSSPVGNGGNSTTGGSTAMGGTEAAQGGSAGMPAPEGGSAPVAEGGSAGSAPVAEGGSAGSAPVAEGGSGGSDVGEEGGSPGNTGQGGTVAQGGTESSGGTTDSSGGTTDSSGGTTVGSGGTTDGSGGTSLGGVGGVGGGIVDVAPRYDFETGTDGWSKSSVPSDMVDSLAQSLDEHEHGVGSLELTFDGNMASPTEWPFAAAVKYSPALVGGEHVTAWIRFHGMTPTGFQFFVQGSDWSPVNFGTVYPGGAGWVADTWYQLSGTVPTLAAYNSIGVAVVDHYTTGRQYVANVYIDAVNW